MPRSASDTFSSRRHNHIQTSPNHQLGAHCWPTRSVRSPHNSSPVCDESSLSHSADHFDGPNESFGRARMSSFRTRRNARAPATCEPCPLPRGSLSERRRIDLEVPGRLVDRSSELDEKEKGESHIRDNIVTEISAPAGRQPEPVDVVAETGERAYQEATLHDEDDADADFQSGAPPHCQPPSAAAVRKLEGIERKPANTYLDAEKCSEPTSPAAPHPPQDFLASMSRIAKLVESTNTSADQSDDIPQATRDAVLEDGAFNPGQWRTEVLQRVRRMETMLGQMERWHAQGAPGQIEALKLEAARLEGRVRAMAEQERVDCPAVYKSKANVQADVVQASSPEVQMQAGTGLGTMAQAGGQGLEDGDASSTSDSAPESNSCLSESETGPTDPDPNDRSPLDDEAPPLPARSSPLLVPTRHGQVPPKTLSEPSTAPVSNVFSHTLDTLAPKNHNLPPEQPQDPVEYLTKHPWTMLEVLFLIEVVAHFPPAEHGWTFIAEAYSNILITRPLQEWFGKQASASHAEEAKMKAVLRNMIVEARQLRTSPAKAATPATPARTTTAGTGECGKTRAEASGVSARDAQIVTQLPFPVETRLAIAGEPSAPPPAQRIVPLPRRRPPLTLPSEDARAFTRVMTSVSAGVRSPSPESRAAMLALYSATKPRFPVRTPWDCWHRWCTPWVVQGEPTNKKAKPSVVLDYVVGNIAVPCGTWISQSLGFDYLPVPGTYPQVPGVQHGVSTKYDPRLGIASFARMTHLIAEKTWLVHGLGRDADGRVSDEVLASRRAKLPATLAGLWPGKAKPPTRPGANVQPPVTASPVSAGNVANATSRAPGLTQHSPPTSSLPSAGHKGNKPDAATKPAGAPKDTDLQPLPFRPLPTPRQSPPRHHPRVPEGTLGNTVRPGIRPWFDHAAVRLNIIERLSAPGRAQEKFEEALRPGAKDNANSNAAADVRVKEWEKQRERERAEFGRWVPPHLGKIVVPPRPLPPPSFSSVMDREKAEV